MPKSIEQLKREATKLQEQIQFLEQSENKILEYVAAMRQAIKDAGFEVEDVVKRLREKKPAVPKTDSAAATEKPVPQSQDENGMKPEIGTSYKHSSWPEPWVASGKRAPKHVIATIRSGKTWKQLAVKQG